MTVSNQGKDGTNLATVTIVFPVADDAPDAEDHSKTTMLNVAVLDNVIKPNDSGPLVVLAVAAAVAAVVAVAEVAAAAVVAAEVAAEVASAV